MKNFEKYIDALSRRTCLKRILNFDDCCKECVFGNGNGSCDDTKVKQWLLEEYKEPIQLSHDEYVILKNLPSGAKYIVRDITGDLETFSCIPYQGEGGTWFKEIDDEFYDLYAFNHLFQFVKWEDEEPYSIAQLIADYEKEHDNEI